MSRDWVLGLSTLAIIIGIVVAVLIGRLPMETLIGLLPTALAYLTRAPAGKVSERAGKMALAALLTGGAVVASQGCGAFVRSVQCPAGAQVLLQVLPHGERPAGIVEAMCGADVVERWTCRDAALQCDDDGAVATCDGMQLYAVDPDGMTCAGGGER